MPLSDVEFARKLLAPRRSKQVRQRLGKLATRAADEAAAFCRRMVEAHVRRRER
jgi:hypothetical protein